MTIWWKLSLIAVWTLFVAGCVHTIDLWHAGYVASKREESQIAGMSKADDVFLLGQQGIIDFNQQWSIDREKNLHPCPLPTPALKLLR